MQSLPKFGDLIRESGYYAQKSRKTFAFNPSPRPQAVRAKVKVGYERYGLYVGAAKDQAERKSRHDEIVENCRQEIQQVLASRSEEQPFFFVFGSINAHRPYTPDSGKNLWGIDPNALKGLLPKFLPDAHDVRRDFSDYKMGLSISFVDHCVGIVVDALTSSPHADNTIVVPWSDHGFHFEGVSLVPQLDDPATPRERPASTSSYFGNHSIRNRDWRLVVYEDGAEELYDHRNDPDEFHNLADEANHKAVRDQLARWLPTEAAPEFKARSERGRVRAK